MNNSNRRNAEGYSDPTVCAALSKIKKEEQQIRQLKKILSEVCEFSGFRLKGQITLINKRSGYSYKL